MAAGRGATGKDEGGGSDQEKKGGFHAANLIPSSRWRYASFGGRRTILDRGDHRLVSRLKPSGHRILVRGVPGLAQMKTRLLSIAFIAALAGLLGSPATAAQFTVDGRNFTVPAGFIIERVATTNLVQRPVSGSIDDRGRLYVTDSSGSNLPPAEQLKNPTHRVLRLEDTNGDGIYDKSVVFADNVMFPQGCLWHAGSVYVAGPPSIWKFTDTDGDGVADKREEWFNGGTLTGCANDIHGPYFGPDGFLYWTKGAFAEQTHTLGDGSVLKDRAAHIFRRRPDGTGMGVVMTGGMDNPVGVAFSREGEVFFTSTFIDFSQPGFRDGIGHATYGAVFGKENDVLNDRAVKRTGPKLTQPFIQFGAGAPSGLGRYESDVFGAGYKDNLFASLFNLHKITRHELRPNGATYASTDSDFLVSDDVDFHPTDVLEDGDGSLLVIDTGGWYKLCCPSSQLAKPDVFGAIYRVRKADAKKVKDPHGLQTRFNRLKPDSLVKLLADPRPVVRKKAADELVIRGNTAISAITNTANRSRNADQLAASAFVLGNIRTTKASEALTTAILKGLVLKNPEGRFSVNRLATTNSYRVAALKSLSANLPEGTNLWFEMSLSTQLASITSQERLATFELATALNAADWSTIALFTRGSDPVLQAASLRFAIADFTSLKLRQRLWQGFLRSGDPKPFPTNGTIPVFSTPMDPKERSFFLTVFEGISDSDLRPDEVAPSLTSTNQTLRETAQWIVGRHPEWSGELAGWFRQQLTERGLPGRSGLDGAGRSEVPATNSSSDALRPGGPRSVGRASAPGESVPASTNSQSIAVNKTALLGQLGILTKSDAGQQLLAEAVTNSVFGPETRVAALNAIAGAGLKTPPAVWRDAVQSALGSPSLVAVKAARTFSGDAAVQQSLSGIAADTRFPDGLRLEALGSLPTGSVLDGASVGFLKTKLGSTNTPLTRTAAATTLAKAKLNDDQRLELAGLVGGVGPLELPRLLPAFEAGPTEPVGLRLLASLRDSSAAKSLPLSAWKAVFAKFPAAVKQAAEPFLAGLDAEAPKQAARLESLVAELKSLKGDVRRGQAVFNSSKAACAACHRIGYLGGKLGPDLTSIGQARTERDLLEAIVYPSASFVRSYEPVVATRKDGEEIAGVLRRDGADEIVIGTGPETEATLRRSDITDLRPGTVSVMPQGLDEQLSRQELADLVTFLKNTKWGAN